ncbi:MAG: MBL fold metallo-hydrolase [Pseudomonadota bacterium]
MTHSLRHRCLFTALIAGVLINGATAQDFTQVQIRTTPVADGVWTLQGSGGNLGLVVGDQGAFLIDDQYAPLTEKIQAAIAEVTDEPIRFVFNTHWHGDHTGGNENLAETGALIVAHDNVRRRLASGQLLEFFNVEVPPAADGALPVVTFNDSVTFHLGGHTVYAEHVANAHTDGDSIVHLVEADVIHSGDLVFYGMYPFVDYSSGGSLSGMVRAADRILDMAGNDTKIIAGHGGPIITRAQMSEYRDLLDSVDQRMRTLIEQGQTLEQIIASDVLAEYDTFWGSGFINAERWLDMIYSGMTGESG